MVGEKDFFLHAQVFQTAHAKLAAGGTTAVKEPPALEDAGKSSSGPPALPPGLASALLEYKDLVTLDLPERKKHLPWLPEGGNVMAYGPRGVGKTFFQLGFPHFREPEDSPIAL